MKTLASATLTFLLLARSRNGERAESHRGGHGP